MILFTIPSISLFFINNFKLQKLNDKVINLGSFGNFVDLKDIKRKYNSMINLSKFTSNKKILNEIVVLCSCVLKILSILKKKKNCSQTLYYKKVLE